MLTRRRFLGYAASVPGMLTSLPRLDAETGSASKMAAPEISTRALEIHKRALIFDGHVHAGDREFYHGGSIGARKNDGQWDLARAREGGVGAFFYSVFVPEEYYPSRFETKQALRRIDAALHQLEMNRDQVELALNADDVIRIRAKGKIAAVLDIEGSYDLDGDLGVLGELHRLGLRSAQLSAHNWDQHYADACCSPASVHGLNAHGREVVHEMNRLGMVINVSHASDAAASQAINASKGPVIATHNGLRDVVNIPRNMPDWVLRKMAARGGMIGFRTANEFNNPKEYAYRTAHEHKTFWDTSSIPQLVAGKTIYEVDKLVAPQFPMPGFPAPESILLTPDEWVAVVDRAIQMVGEDHVGFGSDFDGGPTLLRGMRDVRDLPLVTEAMVRRGYSEQRIRKFWGENLLRCFRLITQVAA
ncbi:MAG: dipeptidase [Terriglobia bacterium]